ncbi:hypothetical protein N7478_003729 [Penicillium angulare]|uniref:uncharacterized protein n=1 Tax=Penicillium angulare TaxID=116970 RepID=UPI0025406FBF|nr:uncharacterized protein N7478_003729 [Penicillium angulare]KAJ5288043.1 hypothetical protein N7478_003729 [Penicillium angulare]
MPSGQNSSPQTGSKSYRERLCQRLAPPRPQRKKTIWSPASSVDGGNNSEDDVPMESEADEEGPPNEEMEAVSNDETVKVLLKCAADVDKRLQFATESVESTQQDVEDLKAAIRNIEDTLQGWQKHLGIGDEKGKSGARSGSRLARAKPQA